MTARGGAETELTAQADEYIRRRGGYVDAYSQDRQTRQQLAGHPDRVYWLLGCLLWAEFKIGNNGLTPAEVKWWDRHQGLFNPPYTDGRVIRCLEDVQAWADGVITFGRMGQ